MADFLLILTCTLGAYLIGAIPSSIWLGKLFFGIDIREHGTGSASHLNVTRIMGVRFSVMMRILDIAKGFLAANFAYFIHNKYGLFSDIELPILMMSLGLAAILGHIFPVFAGYRGGKGIHVSLGVLVAIQPIASAIFVGIALIAYLLVRYSYLAYMLGALAVPVYYLVTRARLGDMMWPSLVFAVCMFVLLLLTHHKDLVKQLKPIRVRLR